MTEDVTDAAYDRYGADYLRCMAPIVGPMAVALLDRLDGAAPVDVLDIGTGTGTLILAALDRWPDALGTGVDPSRVMLAFAADAAATRGTAGRLRLVLGSGTDLPLPDASMDLAVSSFVIQLVPSRAAMLREAFRVLRPGGRLAILTWQLDDEPFEPEDLVGDALDELGIEVPPAGGGGSRPYPSPASAAAELRRIGFRDVHATREWLEHQYTPSSFLDTVEHWTDDDVFSALAEPLRQRLRAAITRRLVRLPPSELRWRRPLVSVVGRRPG